MEDKDQTSEENLQYSKGNSDMILFVALVAFMVFIAVAAFIIMTDTAGLKCPSSPTLSV